MVSDDIDYWMGEFKPKKVDKRKMNKLFTKKEVKKAELSDACKPIQNMEMFE